MNTTGQGEFPTRQDLKQLAHILREARIRSSLGLYAMASRLHRSFTTVYSLENARVKRPDVYVLQKFLNVVEPYVLPSEKAYVEQFIEKAGKRPKPPPGTKVENWATLPDYPNYEVSDQGRITRRSRGYYKVLATHYNGNGFECITMHKHGPPKLVSRLVLLAFVGPPTEEKNHAIHKDGDRTNNRLDNLRWGKQRLNVPGDPRLLGVKRTRLTVEKILLIYHAPVQPGLTPLLEKKTGYSSESIRTIRNGTAHQKITGGSPRPTRLGGKPTTTLASRLTLAKAKSKVTLRDLFEAAGITQWYWRKLTSGKEKLPDYKALERLAKALDVPLTYLRDDAPDLAQNKPEPRPPTVTPSPRTPSLVIQIAKKSLVELKARRESLGKAYEEAKDEADRLGSERKRLDARISETEGWLATIGVGKALKRTTRTT